MSGRADLQAVLGHWLAALNRQGDAAEVAAAVADDVVVQRFGFHYQRGQLLEELRGADAVAQWMARTAPVVRFELDPSEPASTGPGAWQLRYIVRAPDDFVGGGVWDLQLDDRGRVRHLRHVPDDLAPEHWGPPPGPAEHDHGEHDHGEHHHGEHSAR